MHDSQFLGTQISTLYRTLLSDEVVFSSSTADASPAIREKDSARTPPPSPRESSFIPASGELRTTYHVPARLWLEGGERIFQMTSWRGGSESFKVIGYVVGWVDSPAAAAWNGTTDPAHRLVRRAALALFSPRNVADARQPADRRDRFRHFRKDARESRPTR
jgi:hypothetical protein